MYKNVQTYTKLYKNIQKSTNVYKELTRYNLYLIFSKTICSFLYIFICLYIFVHFCTFLYNVVHFCTFLYIFVHLCTCFPIYLFFRYRTYHVEMYKNVQKCTCISDPKCTEMYRNVQKYSGGEYTKMYKLFIKTKVQAVPR